MATINDVWAAYDEGQGRWFGCNWPTRYGSLGVDLEGVSSAQAHRTADHWLAVADEEARATADEASVLEKMALHLRVRDLALRHHEPFLRQTPRHPRRLCAETLAREWRVAAYVLAEIERDACSAEREASSAVQAAEGGNWDAALRHARRACLIESGYHAPRPWRRLKRAIERAVR
jgi:hypothetical protein